MAHVKLTLIYQGQLPPTQRGVSEAKARLRRAFHPQIKEQIEHMLGGPNARHVTSEVGGWQFISPAHERFRTAVELEVLLLSIGSLTRGSADTGPRFTALTADLRQRLQSGTPL